jgi:hypothetical protein
MKPHNLSSCRSSFTVQAGTSARPQILRLFPSISLPELYVVHPNGCVPLQNDTIKKMTCENARGGIFYRNLSRTHHQLGMYNFGKNAAYNDFGFTEVPGFVGWDTVKLNQPEKGGRNPLVDSLLVTEIATRKYSFLGMLGLDVRPTNLSELGRNDPQENLLSQLKENDNIPSLSWSYTAGSHWCKQLHIQRHYK